MWYGIEGHLNFSGEARLYVNVFPNRNWKCETTTQATVHNTDLGFISIKEIVEGVGRNMNVKGEHKEKMATDRTLGGSLSTFR